MKWTLFRPKIVPAPSKCPKLVVANNSLSPNPVMPEIGIDGPKPLTLIPYLPIKIAIRLQKTIIKDLCKDHSVALGNRLSKMYIFIFILFFIFYKCLSQILND